MTKRSEDLDSPDDEAVNFQRRAEFFENLHGDRASLDIDMARLQAIEHARKLARARPDRLDPWQSLGPINVNGRIKSLALHPREADTVYAGAADGGVWRSLDRGETWVALMRQELSMAIGALAVAAGDPNVIYAGTGEDTPGINLSYPGVGIYKTSNGGMEWHLAGSISSTRCTRVLVHPTQPEIVYAAGNGGLDHSIDGGKTWRLLLNAHVCDALMDPLDPRRLYAAIWLDGVYKSTDGGVTWRQLTHGIPTGSTSRWIKLAMGLHGRDGTNFLLAKMGPDSRWIFESTDAGECWHRLPGEHEGGYNTWANLIAVDPENQEVILSGGVGLSRSEDQGQCFKPIADTHVDHHQLLFLPSDSRICYLATDGGVYRSDDNGVSWTLRSTHLVATQLFSIGVSQSMPLLIGCGTQDQGIVKSDGSSTWMDTKAGNEGGFFVVDPNTSDNVYCRPNDPGYLRRSTDGGLSWCNVQQGVSGTVQDVAVQPGNSDLLLCVADRSIFRSLNQGNLWESVHDGFGTALRVAFSPSNPKIVYAATSYSSTSGLSAGIFRSTDGGAKGTWSTPFASEDAPPMGVIYALAVASSDPNVLFIGYNAYGTPKVFRSDDGGATWHDAGGLLGAKALPDLPVADLAIHPEDPAMVFAATSIGIFRTLDGGHSWHPFDRGMPRIVTTQLALRRCDSTLYCSTMGRGVYRRQI